MNHSVYINPRAQDRSTVARLFGHTASNRAVREWRPAAALVYDFYEITTASDLPRAVSHVIHNPHSVIVINFSHESMPSDIREAEEYAVLSDLAHTVNREQLVVLCSQQDTLQSIATALPGVGSMNINFWETHVLHKQPKDFEHWLPNKTSAYRLGSLNRRYTGCRAVLLYTLRDLLPNMLYSFGDRGYWTDDVPASVFQDQELRCVARWDNELAQAVQQWQLTHRPWRLLVNTPAQDWNSNTVYHTTADADHWAVVESRAHSSRSLSGFFTEKTFRVMLSGRAVYPITEGNTDATLRHWGYEPYWNTPQDTVLVKISALAQHLRWLYNLEDAQYQRHQQSQAEIIAHNLHNLHTRTSPAHCRSQAPARLKPYFR